MWYYSQDTGILSHGGDIVAGGYSGNGLTGRNKPEAEHIPNIGPIPRGQWLIGEPIDSPHTGPYSIPLICTAPLIAYGRSGFYIHGDSSTHPGLASDGCLVFPRQVRERIVASGDKQLTVTL